MTSAKLFAFVLLALGIVALAYPSILGVTLQTAGGNGSAPAPSELPGRSPSMIAGAVTIAAGIFVLIIDGKKRKL